MGRGAYIGSVLVVLLLGMGPAKAEDYRFVAGQVKVLSEWCGLSGDIVWLEKTFKGISQYEAGKN